MIAIVSDSTVYLTKQEAEDIDVHVVPMVYTINGQMYHETFIDRNGDYIKAIAPGARCATAQAPVSAFMSTFEQLLRKGYEILCITISSRLSGTYSSASIAARDVGEGKIIVVDSLCSAGGMKMLVQKARKLIDAGTHLDELVRQIERMRDEIMILFSVDDMRPLRSSGRLGIVRQSAGTILNMRPILRCSEGAVVSDGTSRGKNGLFRELVERIPHNITEAVVHYISDRQTAEDLTGKISNRYPEAQTELRPLGPVLGIHLGTGVLAVVCRTR